MKMFKTLIICLIAVLFCNYSCNNPNKKQQILVGTISDIRSKEDSGVKMFIFTINNKYTVHIDHFKNCTVLYMYNEKKMKEVTPDVEFLLNQLPDSITINPYQ